MVDLLHPCHMPNLHLLTGVSNITEGEDMSVDEDPKAENPVYIDLAALRPKQPISVKSRPKSQTAQEGMILQVATDGLQAAMEEF